MCEVLPISELYPYECGVIDGLVRQRLRELQEGQALEPVEVTPVDGHCLVTDGVNRVFAAKEHGLLEMPISCRLFPANEPRAYRDALEMAMRRGRQGFENTPVFMTEGDRQAQRRREEEEDFGSAVGRQ